MLLWYLAAWELPAALLLPLEVRKEKVGAGAGAQQSPSGPPRPAAGRLRAARPGPPAPGARHVPPHPGPGLCLRPRSGLEGAILAPIAWPRLIFPEGVGAEPCSTPRPPPPHTLPPTPEPPGGWHGKAWGWNPALCARGGRAEPNRAEPSRAGPTAAPRTPNTDPRRQQLGGGPAPRPPRHRALGKRSTTKSAAIFGFYSKGKVCLTWKHASPLLPLIKTPNGSG